MSEPGPDRRLNEFLDRVESLLEHLETLEEERAEWKRKSDSLIMELREAEQVEGELRKELEDQRLSFSELAADMEQEFKEIKQLAERLTSGGTPNNS